MKRLKNILYIIGIIILAPLTVALVFTLYKSAGVVFLYGFGFCVVIVMTAFLMKAGVKTLSKERDEVFQQLRFNVPVQYNKGRIFFGFVKVLGFFWLVVPFVFFIPGELWIAVLPLLTVAVWVIEMLVSNFWTDIGWKKSKYWLMNIGIYIFGAATGYIISKVIYS